MKDNEALELLFSSSLGGHTPPVRIELDPGYRFPPHRRPDPRRPTPSANDGRPTDPAVLAEIEQLVTEFAARFRAANGEPPQWEPGYSEDQIAAAEAQIGLRLPEDLRAFYRLIHSDGYMTGVAGLYGPVPLEQVVEWYSEIDEDTFNGENWLFAGEPVMFDAHPHGLVRRTSANDRWVPYATDNAMNFGAVDLDPAPGGQYGQIFMFGRDTTEYVAPSITHLMRAVLTEPEGLDPDTNPGGWKSPDHELRVDGPIRELVAAESDPGRVQHVLIAGISQVRLRDLAGLPALRSIEVGTYPAKAEHVDLTLPAGAPVEFLDVTAASFEPERLAGAPDLAYLTLSGNEQPVRIAALATLPGLLRLNLSGAGVAGAQPQRRPVDGTAGIGLGSAGAGRRRAGRTSYGSGGSCLSTCPERLTGWGRTDPTPAQNGQAARRPASISGIIRNVASVRPPNSNRPGVPASNAVRR